MPRSQGEVLILEDDPAQSQVWRGMVYQFGLWPLEAATPTQADQMLNQLAGDVEHDPMLAIVKAGVSPNGHSVEEVLEVLDHEYGSCLTIIHSSNISSVAEQATLRGLHSWAIVKRSNQVLEFLDDALSKPVGDLRLEQGRIVFRPEEPTANSGQTWSHPVAIKLYMFKNMSRNPAFTDSEAKMARRFDDWLSEMGSKVHVVALGDCLYRLEVDE